MKPSSEFRDRLFTEAGANVNQIVEFSCDHIIPAENVLPIVLTHGPDRRPLLFNYENRSSLVRDIFTSSFFIYMVNFRGAP